MALVRASISYEPATGSTVFATPDSHAMICCVRSASVADSSVGSASASSRPLQWSDCAPPQHRSQGLHRDPHQVVVRLLRGQRAAGRLRMKSELLGARVRDAEPFDHQSSP
jgi:hypothetical protein